MNLTVRLRIVLFAGIFLYGCTIHADSEYFNGPVSIVEEPQELIPLSGHRVDPGVVYPGWLNACDSLVYIFSFSDPEYYVTAFNYYTNEPKGRYFPKGNGPGEYMSLLKINHFYEEEGQIKAMLYEPYQSEAISWNVTCSLQSGQTVYDSFYLENEDKLLYGVIYKMPGNQYITYTSIPYEVPDGSSVKLGVYDQMDGPLRKAVNRLLYTNVRQ